MQNSLKAVIFINILCKGYRRKLAKRRCAKSRHLTWSFYCSPSRVMNALLTRHQYMMICLECCQPGKLILALTLEFLLGLYQVCNINWFIVHWVHFSLQVSWHCVIQSPHSQSYYCFFLAWPAPTLNKDSMVRHDILRVQRLPPRISGQISFGAKSNSFLTKKFFFKKEVWAPHYFTKFADIFGGDNGNPLQYSCLENPMDRGDW